MRPKCQDFVVVLVIEEVAPAAPAAPGDYTGTAMQFENGNVMLYENGTVMIYE